ncbi:hypothetical protein ACR4XJ_00185 [Nitratidesulfovibrio sp. D1]|uniref:hypothetical protein n=1 Tax=Nitratidesulfovibrio sp. D1 TaxID=3440151 RepID=UPI003EB8B248
MHRILRTAALLVSLTVTLTAALAVGTGVTLGATTARAAGGQITALDMFRMLPATIFENTAEGLSDEEKQQLADEGETGFWAVIESTPEHFEVGALPMLDTRVSVRVFRADNGDTLAAMGVKNGEACALELWRRKPDGRLAPAATPEEPDIAEFFAPGHKLPPGTSPSVMLCLGENDLEARALLWTSTGLAQVKFDHRVLYRWNGSTFSKVVLPVSEQ